MLIAINGTVYNSEDEKVSILLYKNEQQAITRAIVAGDDIFNTMPKDTPKEDVDANVQALKDVFEALHE